MSARVNILSTKRLEPLLAGTAAVHGIRIVVKEFIRIETLESGELAEQARKATEASSLVFTSSNAVDALYKLASHYHIEFPRGMKVFATEGRTATRVKHFFPQFSIVATAQKASQLAEKIIAAGETTPVMFCGNLRRNELPDALAAQGIALREIQVYRTEPTPVRIEEKFDGIIFFSPSAVSSYLEKNRLTPAMTCFTVGDTTAESLKDITKNICIAPHASQEKVVEMIIEHYKAK